MFSGFLYSWGIPLFKLNCTSRKLTIQKSAWIIMFKPAVMKILIRSLRFLSVCGSEMFCRIASPPSLCIPIDSLSTIFDRQDPTSAQTSALFQHPMGTYKFSSSYVFTHGFFHQNKKIFLTEFFLSDIVFTSFTN